MPKYTLTYFNGRGIGESARLLLAYGGQEFEDNRIEDDDWPKLKPTFFFGQIPVLEIDGKRYAQSLAISRYLGRKYGVTGATLEEDLEIDQNILFYNDVRLKAFAPFYEPTEEAKQKEQEAIRPTLVPLLDKLHEIIVKNNGHIALGKLTWADFVFAGAYRALTNFSGLSDMDSRYPAFKKLHDTVYALPGVKEFAANEPESDF